MASPQTHPRVSAKLLALSSKRPPNSPSLYGTKADKSKVERLRLPVELILSIILLVNDQRTLAACARTCKAVHTYTVPFLRWYTIKGIRLFLSTLWKPRLDKARCPCRRCPHGWQCIAQWKSDINKLYKVEDLATFHRQGQLVRHLHLRPTDLDDLRSSRTLLASLVTILQSSLFPNLLHLSLSVIDEGNMDEYHLFYQTILLRRQDSSLRKLSLYASSTDRHGRWIKGTRMSTFLGERLKVFSTSLPHLTELRITGIAKIAMKPVVGAMASFEELEVIRLEGETEGIFLEVLDSIAPDRFRNLRKFHVHGRFIGVPECGTDFGATDLSLDNMSLRVCANLQHLSVEVTQGLKSFVTILDYRCFASLQRMDIELSCIITTEGFGALCTAIAGACRAAATLTELNVKTKNVYPPLKPTRTSIQALFTIGTLQILRIPMVIHTEGLFIEMGDAWPHLEQLEFEAYAYLPICSATLFEVAQGFPNLELLRGIAISDKGWAKPKSDLDPSTSRRFHQLNHIGFVDSKFLDVKIVGACLASVLPTGCRIEWYYVSRPSYANVEDMVWKRAVRHMRALQTAAISYDEGKRKEKGTEINVKSTSARTSLSRKDPTNAMTNKQRFHLPWYP